MVRNNQLNIDHWSSVRVKEFVWMKKRFNVGRIRDWSSYFGYFFGGKSLEVFRTIGNIDSNIFTWKSNVVSPHELRFTVKIIVIVSYSNKCKIPSVRWTKIKIKKWSQRKFTDFSQPSLTNFTTNYARIFKTAPIVFCLIRSQRNTIIAAARLSSLPKINKVTEIVSTKQSSGETHRRCVNIPPPPNKKIKNKQIAKRKKRIIKKTS